ncbi:hypothetical protein QE152_g37327 [Popillia japonica]|uniref:Uncharacterized protein n=1 Tax=Popillia japonica TaxID=7064 RepID=A0AAW1I9Y4_POPJA
MNAGFESTKLQNEKLVKEIENIRKELQEARDEMKEKEEIWRAERRTLTEKIDKLENKMESQERRERKCNIVIKNKDWGQNDKKNAVKDFIRELHVDVEINEAYELKNKVMIVKLRDWEQKKLVMINKRNLQGKDIYIESDMTKKERDIQGELRKIAKDEKSKGNTVKIGYQKIKINSKLYKWEEIWRLKSKN